MLLLLMLRCMRTGTPGECIALAPAAMTGAVLLVANLQEAYSLERRRFVAYCWIVASAGAAVSSVMALALNVPALATLCAALAAGQGVAAAYAWRRSKLFRVKYYNNYLDG